ncbi:MAG: TA system VapC family ribonuclease toxin [Candidatus Limnocylindrales bacterium]
MPDVNVLIYAHRAEDPRHRAYAEWLARAVEGPEPIALSVLVAIAFVRVVTGGPLHTRTPLSVALGFVEELTAQSSSRVIAPGPGHVDEVARLCRAIDASGSMVADAQHAAIAIEHGCTLISADRDIARFAPHGLRWQHLDL